MMIFSLWESLADDKWNPFQSDQKLRRKKAVVSHLIIVLKQHAKLRHFTSNSIYEMKILIDTECSIKCRFSQVYENNYTLHIWLIWSVWNVGRE